MSHFVPIYISDKSLCNSAQAQLIFGHYVSLCKKTCIKKGVTLSLLYTIYVDTTSSPEPHFLAPLLTELLPDQGLPLEELEPRA